MPAPDQPPGRPLDDRRHAPATLRNRDAIQNVLRDVLPARGTVLEIAAGSGEHAVHFARALPDIAWLPSDPDPAARASITAWSAAADSPNLLPAIDLDAAAPGWPLAAAANTVDAIVCINMLHISPWQATEGLMAGAGRILPAGAPLVLYGPFIRPGHPLEPSNAAFDASLRERDPRWGLRNLEAVSACAAAHALSLDRVIAMPANNLTVVLRKD